MKIGIVGAGLIGKKRGLAACIDGQSTIDMIADINLDAANKLKNELNAKKVTSNWSELISSPNIDVVIITTPNHLHAPIAIASAEKKKHILCEKPLSISIDKAEEMVSSAVKYGVLLKTGFNHRQFPHILKAKEMCDSGVIGELYYIRCHYGHGGREGYDKEWRGDVKMSGGGELMDQGVHVVDLGRWFLGDLRNVVGITAQYHWKYSSLEDNGYFSMSTESGKTLHAHVSWTQWKNSFSFEIYGQNGYIRLSGLAGYYGAPTLILGLKSARSVVPEEQVFKFAPEDVSFLNEWREFESAVKGRKHAMADGIDGVTALKLVKAIYESSSSGRSVSI